MKLLRGYNSLPLQPEAPIALTIGNFDGVHAGHQAILKKLVAESRVRGICAVVMLFEPSPAEYFASGDVPARLYRLRDKLYHLKSMGVDQVIVLKFDDFLAKMTASMFIDDLLRQKLGVRYLLVGDDFHFGKGRLGDFDLLEQAGYRNVFQTERADSIVLSGKRVSSTLVRQALAQGDFSKAAALLGRPYTMTGRVVHGNAMGRALGYPTINVPVRRCVSPLHGVYSARVYGIENTPLYGIANIGNRPMVNGKQFLLEVYLFDWQGDCYGKNVDVEFISYLRGEEAFGSLDEMKIQMDKDAMKARLEFSPES